MSNGITEILVIDTNKVVAKMVGNTLLDQDKGIHVDLAVNVWELRRRLKDKHYDLVIADLSTGMDGEEMAAELVGMPDTSTVYWSTGKKCGSKALTKMAGNQRVIVQKPTSRAEFRAILPGLLMAALG